MATGTEDNVSTGTGWDWRNSHVSESYKNTSSSGLAGGTNKIAVSDFIDSSTTLLCAGPASLNSVFDSGFGADASATQIALVPIGLAMGINLQINRQSSKIYEIGSRLGYTISGRVAGGLSISRALIDGGSLLKVLYAGEVAADAADLTLNTAGFYDKHVKFRTGNTREKEGYNVPAIGSGNVAMNLDSAFFNHPFGLALIMRDQTDQSVSQHYFEGCVITSYSISISAEMNVLTEGVSIEFVRIVPIITSATAPKDYAAAEANRSSGILNDIPINYTK